MKFSCLKDTLQHALNIAERFTGKNVTLPILGNIMLALKGQQLTITATNLEYAIQYELDVNGERDGAITVPAKISTALLQSISSERVELEELDGCIRVSTPTQSAKINGIGAGDFPLLPKIKEQVRFSVLGAHLRDGLSSVLPMVALSEFKPELTGVFFQIDSNVLVCAATDTFRLAEKTIPLLVKNEGGISSFILPSRIGHELSRVFDDTDSVSVVMGENQVRFEGTHARVVSRLIDGTFPEYRGIVPKDFKTSSYVGRSDLVRAVRSSSIFASRLQDVVLHFKTEDALHVNAVNSEVGEHHIEIATTTTGEPIRLNFNHRYLLDGLQVLGEDEIFIGCNAEHTPVLFRNKSDASLLYVLMPIRVV